MLSRHVVACWPADLAGQFVIPFLIWRAISLRTGRDGVVLGLLVTWPAFLDQELVFQAGLAVAVFVAVDAVARPAQVRARAGPVLAGCGRPC